MKSNGLALPTIKSYSNRPLRNKYVKNLELTVADLSEADISLHKAFTNYNFKRVLFNNSNLKGLRFSECNFKAAYFHNCDMRGVVFQNCQFESTSLLNADLSQADFENCSFTGANLSKTLLFESNFKQCTLVNCNLMWSRIIETSFINSTITKCRVFGASIWNVTLENTTQEELVITKRQELEISVGSLEIAQFLYLMVNNRNIKNIIETLTSKIVLILGRFTDQRKSVLQGVKVRLVELGYVPVIFDFKKPENTDHMEPVLLIAQLARFVLADFSDPKVILEEVPRIADNTSTVIMPIIEQGHPEPSTLHNLRVNRLSVLNTFHYKDKDDLLRSLDKGILPQVEAKIVELRNRRKE